MGGRLQTRIFTHQRKQNLSTLKFLTYSRQCLSFVFTRWSRDFRLIQYKYEWFFRAGQFSRVCAWSSHVCQAHWRSETPFVWVGRFGIWSPLVRVRAECHIAYPNGKTKSEQNKAWLNSSKLWKFVPSMLYLVPPAWDSGFFNQPPATSQRGERPPEKLYGAHSGCYSKWLFLLFWGNFVQKKEWRPFICYMSRMIPGTAILDYILRSWSRIIHTLYRKKIRFSQNRLHYTWSRLDLYTGIFHGNNKIKSNIILD